MAPSRVDSAPRDISPGLLTPFSRSGLTLGLVFVWVSLSPSLLPRQWWMTALSLTLSAALGYGLGTILGWCARRIAPRIGLEVRLNPRPLAWLRALWWAALVLVTVIVWVDSLTFQSDVAALVGGTRPHWSRQVFGVLVGMAATFSVILLARSVRALFRWIDRGLTARLPRWLFPGLLATGLVLVLVFAMNQFLVRQGLDYLLARAEEANIGVLPDSAQPPEPERSGSPASLEQWDDLGRHGQFLVSRGPRAADIEAVTGTPAAEPIRVYAGLIPDRSLEEAADAVVAELHRTGGFERDVLVVATTTGSGWIPEWSLQSVEYLTGGDVATATLQYSYTPSGLAYLVNRAAPAEAGRVLFDRIEAEITRLPETDRPRLFVAGESLGSFGSQAAFADLEEVLARVDGAVWSGTPRFTPLWSQLTQQRRPGSPEVAPVVDNGRNVRFVTTPEELDQDYFGGPYVGWEDPRVVYVQHPSDPVVWWDPSLIWTEPDWMREDVGRDVSTQTNWVPWVTFWQLAIDMPNSATVPGGHGHNYHAEMVPVWAAVLGMDDLPEVEIEAIQDAMRQRISGD